MRFPEETGASLDRVWQLIPAPAEGPEVVYAGAEPAALFRSADGVETFELVRGLWDHPHRPRWVPGGGGLGLHTILPAREKEDASALTVAISAGGTYRTQDAGASWQASNEGIEARFLPESYPEYGQCVHKIARDADDPERFYLQNHWGSTGATTAAGAGRTSAPGCRPPSASRSPRTPGAARWRTSSRSTRTPTASPPSAAAASCARRRAGRG
ncbi:hypothetical protein J7E87_05960 [Streptomyces sp. ISL-1]|nr:hypothetical protein [Streptomyces sp. ISL-1]